MRKESFYAIYYFIKEFALNSTYKKLFILCSHLNSFILSIYVGKSNILPQYRIFAVDVLILKEVLMNFCNMFSIQIWHQ